MVLASWLAPGSARGQDAAARGVAKAPPARAPSSPPLEQAPYSPNMWLTVAGVAVFGAAYGVGIPTTAAISESSGSKFSGQHAETMAIPFVGPWLEATGSVESESTKGAPAFVTLGVLQIVGASLAIAGLVFTHDATHDDDTPVTRRIVPYAAASPRDGALDLRFGLRGDL